MIIDSEITNDLKARAKRELGRCSANEVGLIVMALQLHSWCNTAEEQARLEAGLEVIKERRVK